MLLTLKRDTLASLRGGVQMLTKLDRIAEIAKEKPKEKFTSLMQLIDEDILKYCHDELDRNKATGSKLVGKPPRYGVWFRSRYVENSQIAKVKQSVKRWKIIQ